jgi:hypothetical protein
MNENLWSPAARDRQHRFAQQVDAALPFETLVSYLQRSIEHRKGIPLRGIRVWGFPSTVNCDNLGLGLHGLDLLSKSTKDHPRG